MSLLIIGEIDILSAAAYIVTQFVAAVAGAGLLWGSMASGTLAENQDGCKFLSTESPHWYSFFQVRNMLMSFFMLSNDSSSISLGRECRQIGIPFDFSILDWSNGNFLVGVDCLYDSRLQE